VYYEFFSTGTEEEIKDINEMLKKSGKTIIMSIVVDTLNIFTEYYLIRSGAHAVGEHWLNFSLLSLRGKHGWIPFGNLIQ